MNSEIKVSVCVVTYNQEKYIAQCLQSLVDQETDFKFEVIVGEDCSTDNTRKIVDEFAYKYPHLITPLFHKENFGSVENIKKTYKRAKGKYIAHVDGDDLALPNKLQYQFDALEKNMDCNICSHNMLCIDNNDNIKKNTYYYKKGKYKLIDLYEKMPFFAHSSKMLRNHYTSTYWDNLLSNPNILDIDIHIDNIMSKKIIHLDTLLGAYREGVGVTKINGKLNPLIPQGIERAYDKGLIIYKHDKKNLELIKKYYSKAMLRCAFKYAVYDSDIKMYHLYVNKSLFTHKYNFYQLIFIFCGIFNFLTFPIFKIIAKNMGKI